MDARQTGSVGCLLFWVALRSFEGLLVDVCVGFVFYDARGFAQRNWGCLLVGLGVCVSLLLGRVECAFGDCNNASS